MKNIQAILFCGGRGSRLYPITDYFQKVMVPLGSKGVPLLELVIDHLKSFGISDFIALVGYRNNLIKRYFKNGEDKGINIQYIIDSPDYSGTGGALYNIRDIVSADNMLIYYTDILTGFNFNKFTQFHLNHNCTGSIWVDPTWEISQGVISTGNRKVISINNQPEDKDFANTGISLLKPEVFEIIENIIKEENRKNVDLSADVFPKLVNNAQLKAYVDHSWWVDIGSLKRLEKMDDQTLANHFTSYKDYEV